MTQHAETPDYRADAPVSSTDAKDEGISVVFYQLCRKFVDDDRSVPQEGSLGEGIANMARPAA